MLSCRFVRSGVLLAGLLASLEAADAGSSAAPAHPEKNEALLELLTADKPVSAETYARPVPKERPRLRHGDMLSDQGRLRVHGGVSITVGASSEGSFHGSSGWVSYYDPVTGLGLSVGYSQMSGKGYPFGYGGYPYSPYYRSVPDSSPPVWTKAQPGPANQKGLPLILGGAAGTANDDGSRETLLTGRD